MARGMRRPVAHFFCARVMLRRYHHKMGFLLHFPASNESAGAKVDAWLAARGGQRHTFSRSVVLRRYHHNMGAWENLRYRWRLLRVRKATSGVKCLRHVTNFS